MGLFLLVDQKGGVEEGQGRERKGKDVVQLQNDTHDTTTQHKETQTERKGREEKEGRRRTRRV